MPTPDQEAYLKTKEYVLSRVNHSALSEPLDPNDPDSPLIADIKALACVGNGRKIPNEVAALITQKAKRRQDKLQWFFDNYPQWLDQGYIRTPMDKDRTGIYLADMIAFSRGSKNTARERGTQLGVLTAYVLAEEARQILAS